MSAQHSPGPWRLDRIPTSWRVCDPTRKSARGPRLIAYAPHIADNAEANARLISAAPELSALAHNFEITGPDADGLVWLVLHGNGTTGKAMFNLGSANKLSTQVALHLEADRRAAIARATGEAA